MIKTYPAPMTAAQIGLTSDPPPAATVELELPYVKDRIAWALKEAIEQGRVLVALRVSVPPELLAGLAWIEAEFYPAFQRLADKVGQP